MEVSLKKVCVVVPLQAEVNECCETFENISAVLGCVVLSVFIKSLHLKASCVRTCYCFWP